MCENERPTSTLSKIIVRQTDRQTRPKLTTPLRGWSMKSAAVRRDLQTDASLWLRSNHILAKTYISTVSHRGSVIWLQHGYNWSMKPSHLSAHYHLMSSDSKAVVAFLHFWRRLRNVTTYLISLCTVYRVLKRCFKCARQLN